jgi:hypothetical protein
MTGQGSWRDEAALLKPRGQGALVTLHGRLYLVGGICWGMCVCVCAPCLPWADLHTKHRHGCEERNKPQQGVDHLDEIKGVYHGCLTTRLSITSTKSEMCFLFGNLNPCRNGPHQKDRGRRLPCNGRVVCSDTRVLVCRGGGSHRFSHFEDGVGWGARTRG